MSEYDVVVVGGGPAGLSSAKELAEKGLDVLVLELQAQIGQDKTSSWVSSDFFNEKFSATVESSVKEVEINSMHNRLVIKGNYGEIIDRTLFDKILAREAIEEGVEIWVSSPVKDFLKEDNAISGVRAEAGSWSEEIRSEAVIDATGSSAVWSSLFLKKLLNSEWDKQKINQVSEYLMANAFSDNKVSIYFSSIFAPMGFAWIYPGKKGFATSGIRGVRIHPDSALDEFIGRKDPVQLRDSVPIGSYRGQIPMDGPLDSTVSDGVLSVGASAGQIYPFSGHGISYALDAGKLAGRVLAEGVKAGDVSESKLSEYDELWRRSFEKEIDLGKVLQDSLSFSTDQKVDSLIEVLTENSKLQKNFLDIFLARDLDSSLREFFDNEKCVEIFGRDNVDKLLSKI